MGKKRDDCREVNGDEASSGVEARLGMFHGVRSVDSILEIMRSIYGQGQRYCVFKRGIPSRARVN